MKQLSAGHAAQVIGVSTATIRNWAKAGHLSVACARPLAFREDVVLCLKRKIGTNAFDKLTTRANKTGSVANVFPAEYLENTNLTGQLESVVRQFRAANIKCDHLMFLAALRLLEAEGELTRSRPHDVLNLSVHDRWRREPIKAVMLEWRESLDEIDMHDAHTNICNSLHPGGGDDFLGMLYQCVLREGGKSEQGAYYTPTKIVEDSLNGMTGTIETFLDPCCGTGKYLTLAARKFGLRPQNIYGFDCDPLAVMISRINLLMAFKNEEFIPNVFCLDSLSELANGDMFCKTNDLIGRIDAVATNPPWGAYKNSKHPHSFDGKITSGESFSMFLAKSIELLRQDGCLSFVLPESILKIRTHSDIRRLLLGQIRITKLSMLGRQFSGVFTPVIRLDGLKGARTDEWQVLIEKNNDFCRIEQSRFKANAHYAFDVEVSPEGKSLLNKIYSTKHETLLGNAEWALGIVTGNNKKFIQDEQSPDAEQIVRGSDVRPFKLSDPKSFIRFSPNDFQQAAPERFFRAGEKLVYKFISNKLVFAYDCQRLLTLNSANILIPSLPRMSIKVALAYLNSSVFQYVFKKMFSTHKVLRGDLEKLPFPVIGSRVHDDIERMVEASLNEDAMPPSLDQLLFSTFNLVAGEISAINNEVKYENSMELLRERLMSLVRKLEKSRHEQVMQRLDDLVSVYPFNEYEFLIASLMGHGKISLDDYHELRDDYIARNLYMYVFEISAPRGFGEAWAQGHLKEIAPELLKPAKKVDPAYSGQYDFLLDEKIKVEVKASRAVDFDSRDALYVKALSSVSNKNFDMNFQQVKPACCDVFVWVGVWRDVIRYWVLSSKEVAANKCYSPGQHRGNTGEGQLHLKSGNIGDFSSFESKPRELVDKIRAAYIRQTVK
jgi:hypothetical protein